MKYSTATRVTKTLVICSVVFCAVGLLLGASNAPLRLTLTAAALLMFVTSKVVDVVLYGINTSNVCYIVSDKSDKVAETLTNTLGRGVTILHGEGAYTHREKQVLMGRIIAAEN